MTSAIVWMDHNEAKLFNGDGTQAGIHLHRKTHHQHHNGHPKDAEKVPVASDPFFHEVAAALSTATELVILGPGEAKKQFKHHLEAHHVELAKRIVAIRTLDHPTEAQLNELGKAFFRNLRRTGLPKAL